MTTADACTCTVSDEPDADGRWVHWTPGCPKHAGPWKVMSTRAHDLSQIGVDMADFNHVLCADCWFTSRQTWPVRVAVDEARRCCQCQGWTLDGIRIRATRDDELVLACWDLDDEHGTEFFHAETIARGERISLTVDAPRNSAPQRATDPGRMGS